MSDHQPTSLAGVSFEAVNNYEPNPLVGATFETVSYGGELFVRIRMPSRRTTDVFSRPALERLAEQGSEAASLALRMLRLIEEAQAVNQKGQPTTGQPE